MVNSLIVFEFLQLGSQLLHLLLHVCYRLLVLFLNSLLLLLLLLLLQQQQHVLNLLKRHGKTTS